MKKKLVCAGLLFFLAIFVCVSSAAADSVALSVDAVRINSDNNYDIDLSWTPQSVYIQPGVWQGISVPGVTVTPNAVYVVEFYNGVMCRNDFVSYGPSTSTTITRSAIDQRTFQIFYSGTHPFDGRYWTACSNQVAVPLPGAVVVPALSDPGTVYDDAETVQIQWDAVPGAKLYQLLMDESSDFASVTDEGFWPSSATEPVAQPGSGTYYFKVRAWTDAPEYGGYASAWSNTLAVTVHTTAPDAPVLSAPATAVYGDSFTLSWTAVQSARIYELVEDTDLSFPTEDPTQFWPSGNFETVCPLRPGRLYYRVRAWNALPEEGGTATAWSDPLQIDIYPGVPIVISPVREVFDDEPFYLQWSDSNPQGSVTYRIAVVSDAGNECVSTVTETSGNIGPLAAGGYAVSVYAVTHDAAALESGISNSVGVSVLDEEAFLDLMQRRCFQFLLDTTYENGLTRDRFFNDRRATGDTIGEGTDPASIATGGFYLSALTIGVERGWITEAEGRERALTLLQTAANDLPTYHGYFYHFMTPDGQPSDEPFREVSTIDTALFIAGALQAGEYFGGGIKEQANALYERVEWGALFNWYTYLFHMGWDESRGVFGEYGSFSEAFLLYLLAIGSPTHPVPAESLYNQALPKGSYGLSGDMIYTYGGQLFVYQFPQIWFDLRDCSDAFGVNWFENTRQAVQANREYCIANAERGYSEYLWGLSACDGPNGYEAYGARPAICNSDDATIPPYAVASSLPYDVDNAMPALKHLYSAWGDTIWGEYGFADAFNTVNGWVDEYCIGIDKGVTLLMIENYRSALVWNSFMKNEHVVRALTRTRFQGFGVPYTVLEGFEDDSFWTPETSFGWWDADGTYVYQRYREDGVSHAGHHAMKVVYDKRGLAWSCFGGYIAPENPAKDFSQKTRLAFWVYGRARLLVKLRDRAYREIELGTIDTTGEYSWTYCAFDLSNLGNLNRSDIDNIIFFIEPGTEWAAGQIVIDDIVVE